MNFFFPLLKVLSVPVFIYNLYYSVMLCKIRKKKKGLDKA